MDLIAELLELDQEDALNGRACRELSERLIAKFADSPEGKALPAISACHRIIDSAANFMGATIASVEAEDLKEIVFEIVPDTAGLGPGQVPAFLEEVRAFYAFLAREFQLKQASACLAVLGGDAAKRLRAALAAG